MEQKIKDLYQKLKALAERGVGGEKEAAYAKLQAFIAKHGLTEDELASEEPKRRYIKYGRNEFKRKLLLQIIGSVAGRDEPVHRARNIGEKYYTEYGVNLTDAQFIEVMFLFECYSTDLDAQMEKAKEDIFMTFIHVNRIFPKETSDSDSDKGSMSFEELMRIKALMTSMKPTQFHKRLEQ